MPRVKLPNGRYLTNIPWGYSKQRIAQIAIKQGLATIEDFEGTGITAENIGIKLPSSGGQQPTAAQRDDQERAARRQQGDVMEEFRESIQETPEIPEVQDPTKARVPFAQPQQPPPAGEGMSELEAYSPGLRSARLSQPLDTPSPSAAPSPPPREKEYFTGPVKSVLNALDSDYNPIGFLGLGDFIDDQARAISSGFQSGQAGSSSFDVMVAGASASPEKIQQMIDASARAQSLGQSDEMNNFNRIYTEEGKGVFGFLKGLAYNPGIVPEIIVSSFSGLLNPRSAQAGGAVLATGAGYGAAAGSAVGGVGAAPGAVSGTVAAIPYAMAAASTVLETGSTFAELLQEELGDKEFTVDNVRAVLEDPEKLSDLRVRAAGRGIAIGVIDGLTSRLGGAVGAKMIARGGSKAGAVAAGTGIEAVGGSAGEAAGRVVAGQEMDVAEIGLEGIAELPMGAIDVASAAFGRPKYTINGEVRTEKDIQDVINRATPEELSKMSIQIDNDKKGYGRKIQDLIETGKIKNQVSSANKGIDEPSLRRLVDLEKELNLLADNKTQSAKDRISEIKTEIADVRAKAIYSPVPKYSIDGVEMNNLEFKKVISSMSPKEFASSKIVADNAEQDVINLLTRKAAPPVGAPGSEMEWSGEQVTPKTTQQTPTTDAVQEPTTAQVGAQPSRTEGVREEGGGGVGPSVQGPTAPQAKISWGANVSLGRDRNGDLITQWQESDASKNPQTGKYRSENVEVQIEQYKDGYSVIVATSIGDGRFLANKGASKDGFATAQEAEDHALRMIEAIEGRKKPRADIDAATGVTEDKTPTGPGVEGTQATQEGGAQAEVTAAVSNADLAAMSQDQYAEYLAQNGLPEGVDAYDALTSAPEYRGLTAQQRVELFNSRREEAIAWRSRAEELWIKIRNKAQDGISAIGATSGWTNFGINQFQKKKDSQETHKSYISIKDYLSFSEADMQAVLTALQQAGFNGQIKFPGQGSRALLGFDNIVMHGNTEADAALALSTIQNLLGDRVSGFMRGKDSGGKSHSQLLAESIKERLKQKPSTTTTPTPSAPTPTTQPTPAAPTPTTKTAAPAATTEAVAAPKAETMSTMEKLAKAEEKQNSTNKSVATKGRKAKEKMLAEDARLAEVDANFDKAVQELENAGKLQVRCP